MIEKLKKSPLMGFDPGNIEVEAKVDEMVAELNELGRIVDEFTGSAPKYRL